jgi:hypothetical protein
MVIQIAQAKPDVPKFFYGAECRKRECRMTWLTKIRDTIVKAASIEVQSFPHRTKQFLPHI